MGHMYPKNVCKRLLKEVYISKKITLKKCVENAFTNNVAVSCAEGKHKEEYVLQMAFEECLDYYVCEHYYGGQKFIKILEPIFKNKTEQKIWNLWKSGDIHDLDDAESAFKILDNIEIKFAKGARKKYEHKKIPYLESVTH
jgi:hypothetical protein